MPDYTGSATAKVAGLDQFIYSIFVPGFSQIYPRFPQGMMTANPT
jgi:hypothetical protein